jgi:hypothetical protein
MSISCKRVLSDTRKEYQEVERSSEDAKRYAREIGLMGKAAGVAVVDTAVGDRRVCTASHRMSSRAWSIGCRRGGTGIEGSIL